MLPKLDTLDQVIAWGFAQRPPVELVEVVVQDEFTHDVVMARGTQHYVFDTTWLGAVQSVSVWDHRPTADEMLDARIARGWVATPTGTVDGPQVLGHAACRFR